MYNIAYLKTEISWTIWKYINIASQLQKLLANVFITWSILAIEILFDYMYILSKFLFPFFFINPSVIIK